MRTLKNVKLSSDFVVVGGGLAGVCASISAARGGSQVILVQDRPVLGGNSSSEVRLWALGASSHMGNNNRWAREGGVIDELLTENLYRNPEGNPVIFDTVLLDAVRSESNITLLLNTAMDSCEMNSDGIVQSIHAYNSQNETEYFLEAALFCDSTGDGTLGYLAGADYVMGRDDSDDADALHYPEGFGELLGSTIFFYTRDTGKPVRYIPPSYALKDISSLKRLERITVDANGCDYWWIEWGGKKDTIHDSEEIKFSLWEIVYGIWNHIKNSGDYPGAETMTLDWVGMIPGKRESRRFIGEYILSQDDLVKQHQFSDAVSYGGWALDHHPSDGAYSKYNPCYQWHTKGVYSIPYRTMYSRNIPNLFLGGRLISTSRAAFGSTRVMMTCAHNAQAVGAAAVLCKRFGCNPADIAQEPDRIGTLQQYLLRDGQYIPGIPSVDTALNKALSASISASSELEFSGFNPDADWYSLEHAAALLVPLPEGIVPGFSFDIDSTKEGNLIVKILVSEKTENFTPEILLESFTVPVSTGERRYSVTPSVSLECHRYVFLAFHGPAGMSIRRSHSQVSGVLSVYNKFNKKVAYSAVQTPPEDSGIDSFEFWTPYRRPEAKNLAILFSKPLRLYPVAHLTNGFHRPVQRSNAWVADPSDPHPVIELEWDEAQDLSTMLLFFDTDYDFSMESVQYDHPESVLPFCVTSFVVFDVDNEVELYREDSNHQARKKIILDTQTKRIRVEFLGVSGENVPIGLFGIQCW